MARARARERVRRELACQRVYIFIHHLEEGDAYGGVVMVVYVRFWAVETEHVVLLCFHHLEHQLVKNILHLLLTAAITTWRKGGAGPIHWTTSSINMAKEKVK